MIIDVSRYQGVIDWAQAAPHIEGAFIKCSGEETQGTEPFQDSKFVRNWTEAQKAGVRRGPYHFSDGGFDSGSGYTEALFFIGAVQKAGGWGEFRPVIDVEWPPQSGSLYDITQLIECVDEVWESCGKAPIIYTGRWYWAEIEGSDFKWLGECPLWIASYTREPPAAPRPWHSAALWQYTDKGSVPGIDGPVDLNRLMGPIEDILL